MPITIKRLDPAEVKKEFTRTGNKTENLTEYIDALRGLSVGDGFSVQVAESTEKDKKGNFIEVVPDSGDGENVDTVRAFKRRMGAASDELGFNLKWKPKGHRTGEGDESRFVTDWLVVKVVETKVKTTNGSGK